MQVGESITIYTVSGLKKATYYKFNVVAFNAVGNRLAKSVLARAVTTSGEYTNVSKIVLETSQNLEMQIGDKVKVKVNLRLADNTKNQNLKRTNPMKSKEELNALKEEVENQNKKLAELTEEFKLFLYVAC